MITLKLSTSFGVFYTAMDDFTREFLYKQFGAEVMHGVGVVRDHHIWSIMYRDDITLDIHRER